MKRILAFLLAVSLCLSLSACKKDAPNTSSTPTAVAPTIQETLVKSGAEILSYNPLTGAALADGVTAGQRPVAVMINNAHIALPQRGISSADAIFEMVTEGGITRLMALYSDYRSIPQVGPVRSVRDQHLQFAIPLNAILVHIGSSVYAENLLNEYHYQDIDGRYLGTSSFWLDNERAKTRGSEHCWYTDATMLTAGMDKQKINATGENHPLFSFVKSGAAPVIPGDGDAPDVLFHFSDENVTQLTFNAADGLYYKKAYGEPHIDELNGTQLSFQNVVVLTAKIGLKPDQYCTDFLLTEGTGYYIYGGKYKEIHWKKGAPEAPIILTDTNGNPVEVNSGKSYIAVLGTDKVSTLMMDGVTPLVPPPVAASTSTAANSASTAPAA
ncbi:MAG: DUF3048 domain-containing protein [Ruthenibacterium sp.]